MKWLHSFDWGALSFIVIFVGCLLLFVLAARRMRKKRKAAEAREERRRPAPPRRRTRESRVAGRKGRRGRTGEQREAKGEEEEPEDEEPEPPEQRQGEEDDGRGPRQREARGKRGKRAQHEQREQRAAEAHEAEVAAAAEAARVEAEEERRRLTAGLAKTRGGFVARLSDLFKGKQIDEHLLGRVEEVLFTADIGVRTSQELIEGLRKELNRKQLGDADAIWQQLKARSTEILARQQSTTGLTIHCDPRAANGGAPRLQNNSGPEPFVLLVVGVNGTGKTTTIGKLAARLKTQGHSVLLAAGDTFRAAAVQQLEVWGERAGVPVVKGKEGADPSSVIVEALKRAKHEGCSVVIADTAGRLHTKISLMEELQKVRRAVAKQVDGAPHETFIVLDATTGQNAILQAKMFKEALDITGIVLTKLDGTAKGGVVLGICHELDLPVRFIGIGEQLDDLRPFDAESFVDALFAQS